MKGPQFLTYVIPILEVLKENGGAGSTSEIIDKVIEKLQIPEEELAKTNNSGQTTVRNRIQWARFYLSKAGLLDTEKRGVWELTQEGFDHKLKSDEQVYILFYYRLVSPPTGTLPLLVLSIFNVLATKPADAVVRCYHRRLKFEML
jgi:restriction system protein